MRLVQERASALQSLSCIPWQRHGTSCGQRTLMVSCVDAPPPTFCCGLVLGVPLGERCVASHCIVLAPIEFFEFGEGGASPTLVTEEGIADGLDAGAPPDSI